MELAAGTRIGIYEVITKLGEGGMGVVYRARDVTLNRDVALKVLPESVVHDPERIARFRREAQILASLNHPNIAHIHGLEESNGVRALVMELVEGDDLAQRIAHGPIPIEEALPIAKQIAEALEAAHEQGIIHRDLKPANIKVTPEGRVKVLDFGLAKAMEATGAVSASVSMSPTITTPAMTQAGMILGTAAYMSPEQARGRPVDRRADVWAFGAVLYEMLTGARAFAGDDVSDVMASVLAREPDWSKLPATLSPAVAMFLKRSLQKDPRQRVRDIGDISLALSGAFDTSTPLAAPSPPIARPLWRRVLPVAAAALATAFVAALVAWRAWPSAPAPTLPTRFEHAIPDDQGVATATQRPVIALSGNGQVLVYQTRRGIQARAMGEIAARTITSSAGAEPFVSPNGQWVAYFGEGPSGTAHLRKVPIGGGAAVTVCEIASFPLGASWAANDMILFGQPQGIMRVPASGGTPELIVKAGEGETIYGPRLLPSGNAVMFSVTTGSGLNRWNTARVAVQSLSSQTRTVVVEGASDAESLPTGHLIYVAGTTLYGARFDPDHPAPVRGGVPIIEGIDRPAGVAAAGSNYAVSHDGTLVYLTGGAQRRSLVWVNRDGAAEEPITTIPPGTFEDPRLSPDGTRVLATRDGDIWVYDLASGRSSRVTRDGTSFYGAWDPTGTQIAYSSSGGSDIEVWLAPGDGSGSPRQLTKLGGAVHVDSWSSDGRLLVMHQHGTANKIAILLLPMNDAGATPQRFAESATQAEGFRFSPDMADAVYLSEETGQREIYIRPYPGPGGQVTVSVGGGQEPVWGRTGEVFYRSLPNTGNRMFAASVTTNPKLSVKAPTMLFERPYFFAPSGAPRPQYDVTADGKRFLMITSGSASSERPRIVVVQHWFEELKRLVPAS